MSDTNDPTEFADFASRNEDRITTESAQMLSPSDLVQLPKGQAFALIHGGQPVLISIERMSLDTALKAARAAIDACRKEGVQVAVTVLDRGGHAQAVLRDLLAPDLALAVSRAKAYAAVSFVLPTSQLEGRSTTPFGAPAVGGLVTGPGAVPIQASGEFVGAIGVSGAPSGQTDERCARKGLEAIVEDLELGGRNALARVPGTPAGRTPRAATPPQRSRAGVRRAARRSARPLAAGKTGSPGKRRSRGRAGSPVARRFPRPRPR